MKVAFIVPPSYLHRVGGLTNYNMVIPCALQNSDYVDFYASSACWTILDNGAADGGLESKEALLEAGHLVNACEIILPDVIGDTWATLEAVRDFRDRLSSYETDQCCWMGVLQGKDFTDLFRCLEYYAESEWITAIGIPRVLCETLFWSARVRFLEAFAPLFMDRFYENVHCLGSSRWLKEVEELAEFPFVRGIDTSAPFNMGWNGFYLGDPYMHRVPEFFDLPVTTDDHNRIINHNMREYMRWAKCESTL